MSMNTFSLHPGLLIAATLSMAVVSGCSTPSQANIELRKQNQDLREQVDQLTRLRTGDAETLRALEAKSPTVAILPKDRIDKLYTTHGITLGKLTGGWDQ